MTRRVAVSAIVAMALFVLVVTGLDPVTFAFAAPNDHPQPSAGASSSTAKLPPGKGRKTATPTATATAANPSPTTTVPPAVTPTSTPAPTSPATAAPTATATPPATVDPSPRATAAPSPTVATPSPTAVRGVLGLSALASSAGSVPLYEKLELTFEVLNSVATNLQFPFDPSPPPGLEGQTGISVEGLFLPPGQSDWSRALRQPGFLYQDYERQQIAGSEWLYPRGNPIWKVRFAPKTQGTWRYKVRIQDGSNYPDWVESGEQSFTALPAASGNHGFVEVSKNDPRYFAFSDDTAFAGLGHGSSFSNANFTYDADQQFDGYSANGVDFLRVWMTGSNIAGSAWGPWVWFGGPGYGGYLQDPGLYPAPPGSGRDFVFNLNQQAGRTAIFNGWSHGRIAVKPATSYKLSVTAQVTGVTGPRNASNPNYGFTVKMGGWASSAPDGVSAYRSLTPHLKNTDWTTVEGAITTGTSQYFLDYLYLLLDNVSTGEANIGEVSLREVLAGGELGPEILAKSRGDAHTDFNLLRSWDWDYVLDQASRKGIYLKLVVLEKNDRVWNRISADGTLSGSDDNNSNFYGAEGTKVRRLQEYYWRYLAARWGYSTAVQSWELLNEGDPYNGNHYDQANSFARYMHQNEATPHLVTTSLWHSFPAADLWGNPAYPDIDYADLHAYVSTGIGSYEWSAPSGTALETNTAYNYQGSAGAIRVPAGVASGSKSARIRGKGEWRISAMVRAQDIVGSCPYGTPASQAGPQLLVGVDSPNTRVIPADPQNPNSYWTCTSPAGSYDYRKIEGTVTLPDDNWHQLVVSFMNNYATSGTAWFDNLLIQGPDGRTLRLYGDGSFDDRERMDQDSALYTGIYSLLDGANSASGAGKPVVRGEAGIDYAGGPQQELPELARDTRGVWLHNYLWGTLNPGGLYELYWWTDNIQKNNLYFQYKPLADFLAGIPLANGHYRDARARASDSNAVVVGQSDSANGRAHLWIRNRSHTWWNVVNGAPWGRLSGTVTVPGFAPNQPYAVEWWQFDDPGNLTKRVESVTADAAGNLTLNLSALPATVTDAAVKIDSYAQP